jgi:hypothetical protein
MPVYFFTRFGDRTTVKIGHSRTLDKRVSSQTAMYGPIELIATLAGDKTVERLVHHRFHTSRAEGEWFSMTDELAAFIASECEEDHRVFEPRSTAVKTLKSQSALDHDIYAAQVLMGACVDRFPSTTGIAQALEKTFIDLSNVNEAWTRRRVRAIREGAGRRIDLFEIIDMLNVLRIPQCEWAAWMRPLSNVTAIDRARSRNSGLG